MTVENPNGSKVSCSGVVTRSHETLEHDFAVIQDGDKAVMLLDTGRSTGIQPFQRGDRVQVQGTLKLADDVRWEVLVTAAERLGAAPEPPPYDVMIRDLRDGRYASVLVRISGQIRQSGGTRNPRFGLRDRTGHLRVRLGPLILGDPRLIERLSRATSVEIAGTVEYRREKDGDVVAALWPRDSADFTFQSGLSLRSILTLAGLLLLGAAILYAIVWARAARRHTAALTKLTESLRQSEAVVRGRELLYRSVTETASDAIFRIDAQCRIRFANHAATRVFGWSNAELLEKGLDELMPDACKPSCGGCNLAGRTIETRAVHRDGRSMEVEISLSPCDSSEVEITAVARDVTDRKQAEEEVQKMYRALRRLSQQLLRAQDVERRRIARELHDGTNQNLAALQMNLSTLRSSRDLRDEVLQRLLTDSQALVDQSSREIRSLSYLLHPPLLDELGLESVLQTYVEGFSQRTGLQVTLQIESKDERLARDTEIALFRIVQEALANIHRHSGSARASIRLERAGADLELDIADEGRGAATGLAPAAPIRMGVGLLGMRERTQHLGGRLELTSGPAGTTIRIRLPLAGNLASSNVEIEAEPAIRSYAASS